MEMEEKSFTYISTLVWGMMRIFYFRKKLFLYKLLNQRSKFFKNFLQRDFQFHYLCNFR